MTGDSTAEIIAYLRDDAWWKGAAFFHRHAAASRLEQLDALLIDCITERDMAMEACGYLRPLGWSPPTGPRVAGVPPWQAGRLLGQGST